MVLKKEILRQASELVREISYLVEDSGFALAIQESDGLVSLVLLHSELPDRMIPVTKPSPKIETGHQMTAFTGEQ